MHFWNDVVAILILAALGVLIIGVHLTAGHAGRTFRANIRDERARRKAAKREDPSR